MHFHLRRQRQMCIRDRFGCAGRSCHGYGGEDKKEVLTHTGRERYGIPSGESHDRSGQRRGEARSGGDGAEIHPGRRTEHRAGQHGGLHEDDVHHRDKRRGPGYQLRANRRVVFREAKEAIESGHGGQVSGLGFQVSGIRSLAPVKTNVET